MPGTKRTFAYRIIPNTDDFDRTLRKAEKILGWRCDGDRRIDCHGISGTALGVIELNLTVIQRDRWAATQLAQDILNEVLWGIKTPAKLDLASVAPPPHDNRGYERGNRTKRYREPRPRAARVPHGPGVTGA